jgi:hypothetical protein
VATIAAICRTGGPTANRPLDRGRTRSI